MSRKGPKVDQGILDFVEDCGVGVKSQNIGETGDIDPICIKKVSLCTLDI